MAEIRLTDRTSNIQKILRWDAKTQSTGWYSLALDAEVGHDLTISGMLYAGASVDSSATLAHWAQSDFSHTANFYLRPSVAALNTVGASGHDFTLSAVPEPSSAALLALGLLGQGRRRFAPERDILAALRHPHIAPFYDAGTAELPGGKQQPWLALEYVPGLSISAHCQARALAPQQRLRWRPYSMPMAACWCTVT